MSHHWATRQENTSGRVNGHLPKAELKMPILHATDSNCKWWSRQRERRVCDKWIRRRRVRSIARLHSQIWPLLDRMCSSSGRPRHGSCPTSLLIPAGCHPSTSLPPPGRCGDTVLRPLRACTHARARARRIHVARRHNRGACKLRSSATTLLLTANHSMAAAKRSSTNGVGVDSLSYHEFP